MARWEYKVKTVIEKAPFSEEKLDQKISHFLNQVGSNGWEAFAVLRDGFDPCFVKIFMKKEV